MVRTQVKTYSSDRAYQRDMERMLDQGWTLLSSQTLETRGGCLRWLFFGPFALLFRGKPKIKVTYQHQ